jgi:dsRNA-specific ribonuclease
MDSAIRKEISQETANGLLIFNDKKYLYQALTHKAHELEVKNRKGKYDWGNYEEWVIVGQAFLEILFLDYMLENDYPNQATPLKKTSDILVLRQSLLTEKNYEEIALKLRLDKLMLIGN